MQMTFHVYIRGKNVFCCEFNFPKGGLNFAFINVEFEPLFVDFQYPKDAIAYSKIR